ncbi:hypothetical protein [Enhygromyxa salina]|uniref:hypothetical protein n=1 Tax=Enhygromyxa salina TaxID=215803 RepID=UPI0011B20658|nr:hypothetical protein [Enhygromyxa salina]
MVALSSGCSVEVIEYDGSADDNCGPDCGPVGTERGCVELLEGSSNNDVLALLPADSGQFFAAGAIEVGSTTRGWVSSFSESGEQRWLTQIELPSSDDVDVDVRVLALAPDQASGVWALAVSPTMDYLVHLDQDGASVSTVDLDAEVGLYVSARAIAATSAGIWVAGTSQADMWLAVHDPTTNATTTRLLEDHLGFKDEVQAMGVSPTELAIAATVSTSPNFDDDLLLTATTDILVIQLDLQGTERTRTLLPATPDSPIARHASSISADAAGRWFVGGVQRPRSVGVDAQLWVARVDPEQRWEWTSDELLDSVGFAGIVGVDDGVLAAGGQLITADADTPSIHAWLGSVASDGALRWQHANRPADHDHNEYKVLVRDAEGRIRAASKAWGPGDSSLLRSCLISY